MASESNGSTLKSGKARLGVTALIATCLGACNTSEADPCASDTQTYAVAFLFAPAVTEAGDYRVSVESSQVSGTCDLVVGSTSLQPCTSARMTVSGVGTSGRVELESLRVWFDYAPLSVKLTLERDNIATLSRTFQPNYALGSGDDADCAASRRVEFDVPVP